MKEIVLMLLILHLSSSTCFGEDCAYRSPPQAQQQQQLEKVISYVEKEIRRAYPAYISSTNLLQLSTVTAKDRYLIFFVYRNARGMFYVIASWYFKSKKTQINDMVRPDENSMMDGDQLNVNHPLLKLQLKQKFYKYYYDENKNLIVLRGDGCMDEDTLDSKLKTTFWYFLKGAKILMHYWKKGNYGTLAYGNVTGTFLVHYKCSSPTTLSVCSFVRLASGGQINVLSPYAQS